MCVFVVNNMDFEKYYSKTLFVVPFRENGLTGFNKFIVQKVLLDILYQSMPEKVKIMNFFIPKFGVVKNNSRIPIRIHYSYVVTVG